LDLDDLGMPRVVGADIFIGRVVFLAAGVPDRGLEHTRHLPKLLFDSPEAPRAESRLGHRYSSRAGWVLRTPMDRSAFPARHRSSDFERPALRADRRERERR